VRWGVDERWMGGSAAAGQSLSCLAATAPLANQPPTERRRPAEDQGKQPRQRAARRRLRPRRRPRGGAVEEPGGQSGVHDPRVHRDGRVARSPRIGVAVDAPLQLERRHGVAELAEGVGCEGRVGGDGLDDHVGGGVGRCGGVGG